MNKYKISAIIRNKNILAKYHECDINAPTFKVAKSLFKTEMLQQGYEIIFIYGEVSYAEQNNPDC